MLGYLAGFTGLGDVIFPNAQEVPVAKMGMKWMDVPNSGGVVDMGPGQEGWQREGMGMGMGDDEYI